MHASVKGFVHACVHGPAPRHSGSLLAMNRRLGVRAVVIALLIELAGCAGVVQAPVSQPVPVPVAPPPPPMANPNPPSNVNLQGFPLPYRQGYADGCASLGGTEQKDAARFKSDGQYRTGWQDGLALCRKR